MRETRRVKPCSKHLRPMVLAAVAALEAAIPAQVRAKLDLTLGGPSNARYPRTSRSLGIDCHDEPRLQEAKLAVKKDPLLRSPAGGVYPRSRGPRPGWE
jgi:hypothetical protein